MIYIPDWVNDMVTKKHLDNSKYCSNCSTRLGNFEEGKCWNCQEEEEDADNKNDQMHCT
jgi:hypothetical protein